MPCLFNKCTWTVAKKQGSGKEADLSDLSAGRRTMHGLNGSVQRYLAGLRVERSSLNPEALPEVTACLDEILRGQPWPAGVFQVGARRNCNCLTKEASRSVAPFLRQA